MKKGFIFSLDSFFALIMFTLFTIMIYFFFIFSSPTIQQYYFSEDLLNVLSSTKISDLSPSYVNINNMINNGTIKDTSSSVLEAIISLQAEGNTGAACLIFKDITNNILPPGYKIGLDLSSSNICGDQMSNAINIISRGRTSTGKIQV